MKALTLKRYFITSLKFFLPFVFIGAICIALGIANALSDELLLFIGVFINGIALFLPGAYYFIMYLVFSKKCNNYVPKEGVIYNWELGFFRYSGGVIIMDEEREYSTSAYFSSDEAKELVGKTALYSIIDGALFIYEIKE